MTKCEKRFLAFSMVMGGVLFVPQSAYAMHIMEGYLPPAYCAAWGALCLPFLAAGVVRLRRTVQAQRKALLLLAMSGAFIFVISSLKLPSVTGSCSHMTGTGLAAILFGPAYGAGAHRAGVPGGAACPRRPHHAGGQYLQHGHRRASGLLGCLCPVQKGACEP